jgi:AcrR family transcriptional regulator
VGDEGKTGAVRKSDVTRARILAAAARLFRDKGYSATRLSDIAEVLGLGVGSLYYHFPSREALVEAVMERGLRQTYDAVAETLAAMPPDAGADVRLRAIIECHVLTLLAQEDLASATMRLLGQVPQPIFDRHIAKQKAYGEVWRELLGAGRASGAFRADVEPILARRLLLAAMNWAADWYKPGELEPRDIARQIATVLTEGLLAAPPSGDPPTVRRGRRKSVDPRRRRR